MHIEFRTGFVVFTFAVMALMSLPTTAANNHVVLDNFNQSALQGWWSWCDPQSERPKVTLVPDTAEGSGAMLITFPHTKGTALVARSGVNIPSSCNALSLWVKKESGAPGCNIVLENDPKRSPDGIDCFSGNLPIPNNDQWNHVIIPLKNFGYAYSKGRTGKKVFDQRKIGVINFCAYNRPEQFSFKIDNLEFVTLPENASDSDQPARKNLLSGDTSFETGPGSWIFMNATNRLTVDHTTGALGGSSIKLAVRDSAICNSWRKNLLRKEHHYTFSFYAKSDKNDMLSCTVLTPDWRWIAEQRFSLSSEWTRYQLHIKPQSKNTTCYFVFGIKPRQGNIWIDGIQLEDGNTMSAYAPAEAISMYVTTGEPGEIIVHETGKSVKLKVSISNAELPAELQPFTLSCTVKEFPAKDIYHHVEPLYLEPGQAVQKEIMVMSDARNGYFPGEMIIRDKNGRIVKQCETPFAVVEPVTPGADPTSFFGMHPNYVPLDALRRIGVKWIRNTGAHWRFVEPSKNEFKLTSMRNFTKAGMKELCTLEISNPPTWAQGKNGLPQHAEMIAGFIKKILEVSNRQVSCYELQNEPDLALAANKQLPAEETARHYAEMMKIAYPLIHQAGNKLLFDVSGEGSGFSEQVFNHAAAFFDIYGPHPYTNPRFIGPTAGNAIGPEDGKLKERLQAAADLIKKHGQNQELWIGELGWGIDMEAGFDSPYARQHAEYLARTHLIAKANPKLKRLIWFTSLGCVEGSHYEYGIWTNREGVKPLPSVAAYANLASLLDHAVALPPICDNEIKVYVYQKGNMNVIAVWDSTSDENDNLAVSFTPEEAEIRNLTGSVLTADSPLKPVVVKISSSPFFIIPHKADPAQICAKIKAVIANRRPVKISLGIPNRNKISLTVRNNLLTTLSGTVSLTLPAMPTLAAKPFSLSPGGTTQVDMQLAQPLPIQGGEALLTVKTASEEPVIMRKNIPVFTPCGRFTGQDFFQSDIASAPGLFVLDRQEQVMPADPTVGWKGPEDLAVKGFAAWDDQYFYFAAIVSDRVFHQPFNGNNIWQGDSIQMAFDTDNDAIHNGGYDQNDYEYGFARVKEQPLAWRWHAPAGKTVNTEVKSVITRITLESGRLIYRIAIPWSELQPLSPQIGRIFGFNFVVNNNNGFGRNYWMGLTPGLSEGKNPALFKKFVLVK